MQCIVGKNRYFLTFSNSGSIKINFNANICLLMRDQNSYFLICVCVCVHSSYPNMDAKQIKILVLVLPELGFECLRKAQKYFKTGGREGGRTNERPGTYHVTSGPFKLLSLGRIL